jgi:peptide/nickel transport system permease protein
MWIHRAARHTTTILITVLLGGLLGATLLRFAPGFGVDEQELDTRLSGDTIQALRDSHAGERNVLAFYARYLSGLARGDLGVSRSLQRPVAELLTERIPVTLRLVGVGLLIGWLLGLALALPVGISGNPAYDLLPGFLSGSLLSLPSALVALLFLLIGGPGPLAIALVIAPKVYRYSRNLLAQTSSMPHVLAARAKGLSRIRILMWHVLPIAAPQIVALAGVSVSIAFGASIPIEVICDFPGIGQLAWQAALARDLPLLVNLTVLVTVVTLVANSASDLAVAASPGRLQ